MQLLRTPPKPATRTIVQAVIAAAAALLLLGAAAWWLAGLTPAWYRPPDPNNAATAQLGEAAEYRLVEEFQKIRPEDEVWRLRIPEDAINAWLATRLPRWLAGQDVQWPAHLGPPQVHITPAGIEVAIASDDFGGRIGRFRAGPAITGDRLTLESPTLGFGRLPLPLPASWIQQDLQDALAGTDDLGFLVALLQGDAIDAAIPLVDHRHIRLHLITLEPGACVLKATTVLR